MADCVSAYICRTKQWSFFFWYYYIQHGIEKTIYYGSKRATTKERELTCLLKMTFYILEFQRFFEKYYHERAIFYYQEHINQRTGSLPHFDNRRACRQTTFSTDQLILQLEEFLNYIFCCLQHFSNLQAVL